VKKHFNWMWLIVFAMPWIGIAVEAL